MVLYVVHTVPEAVVEFVAHAAGMSSCSTAVRNASRWLINQEAPQRTNAPFYPTTTYNFKTGRRSKDPQGTYRSQVVGGHLGIPTQGGEDG